jgi:general secretion pathway protein A
VCIGAALVSTAFSATDRVKLLATTVGDYLISARAVIADNQALINDHTKGDRRFTPEVYEPLVHAEFLKQSGVDIMKLRVTTTDIYASSLVALHQSAMEVIAEAQAQINQKSGDFKGFNPAVFGSRLGQKFYPRSDIRLKQTSVKYRANYNKPDDFETRILALFASSKSMKPHYEKTRMNGLKTARYVIPLYITKPCLNCHGEPAGEIDISGRAKEGYKEGELRGAISVVVPLR